MEQSTLLTQRVPPSLLWTLFVLGLVLAGQGLQSGVHLNHDVSYFVHFSRWLLQGRELGTDLHDGNLPMVWGLFMPSAALAQAHVMSEATAVRLAFWAFFLLSAALLAAVLRHVDEKERPAATGWLCAFVLVATLAPGFSFGQREHASVLFAMPYLAAAVVRLNGGVLGRPLAVTIGLLAGIGFAIKPHFLAIPAFVELWLLARLGWRSLFARTESIVLALTVLTYVIAVAVLLGDYLRFIMGLARYTYWAYSSSNYTGLIDRYMTVAQPYVYGGVIALITRTWTRQHTVLLLAGLGYSVCYFVQAKGFVYHGYPVLVCSMTFLGICLGPALARAWKAWQQPGTALRYVLLPVVVVLALPSIKTVHDGVVGWYASYNIRWGNAGMFRQAVIEMVDHFAPSQQSYFFAFTTHPFPAFPTASYSKAEYTGRSIVQSTVAAYARLGEVRDPERRAGILRAADYQRRIVIEDFERRPPSIVFAERSVARLGMNGVQFDDIAFYLRDPRFRQIWQNYEEHPPMGPLRVFVRKGGGARDQ